MVDEQRDRIAELLRQRLEAIRVRDGDLGELRSRRKPRATIPAVPGLARRYAEAFDPESVAPDASEIRARWISRHRGRDVAEALEATPGTLHPDLFEHVSTVDIPILTVSREVARAEVRRALWLLPGVRDATAVRLIAAGISDLDCARDHDRFGRFARRVLGLVESEDAAGLLDYVGGRGARTHPLALALTGFLDPGDFLFLDLETMGLFGGSPIVVAGLARATTGGVEIRQFVAASPGAEAALVRETARLVESHRALVTFNGRAFDLPYLCARAAFYGAPVRSDPVHFDLLGFSRRQWKGRVPDCRLDTLAREILGMKRDEDVPGSLVPVFYQEYLEDPRNRVGLLAAIAIHNRHDMAQTARLFSTLCESAIPGTEAVLERDH
jgi:hypothetical protein